MQRRRIMWPVAVTAALVAALGVIGASAAPAQTQDNVVTQWDLIATNTLVALPPPAGGAAPAAQISMGMVQGAVYDAVNSIAAKYRKPYLLKRRFAASSSKRAAAVTAAYKVLSNIISTVPESIAFPAKATVLQTLDSQYAASLAAIPDAPSKVRGVAAGNAAATAMIAARQGDGRFGPSQWVPSSAPGHWQPLVSPTGQPILDPTAWVGGVKPFLLESSSQFRTSPPFALNSADWAREFNEVKIKGSATATVAERSATETYIARWWQTPPHKNWNDVARDLIGRNGLDIVDSARLLAMQNLSAADASINCWNDKYHYDSWRPWNAIPRAAEDGNDATTAQAGWAPLFSAPYPDHPSGANCLNSAHLAVLRMFFGDVIEDGFDITSISTLLQPGNATTRHFDTFSQPLAELVEARVWAGLHYRRGDVQGQLLGLRVANYMAANYFQPVGGGG
jgi:hypothetical protein